MEEQAPSDWTDRRDRRRICVGAVAYLPDGSAVPVRVTDISYEGCKVESETMLPIGSKLKLALARLGEINAQVRWSLEGAAGISFLLEESLAADRQPRIRF